MLRAARLLIFPLVLLAATGPSFAQMSTEQLLAQSPEKLAALKNDPHVAKAMTAKQGINIPAGSGAQMPLWQFENELREDPLWKKTNNARESMMTVARQVAKDFGLAY